MPQSDKPSGATLGYLAPICVAVFFIFVCIRYRIIFGRRRRFNPSSRPIDPESWPLGLPAAVLSSTDLDSRFPLIKYSAWSPVHRAQKSKEAEVVSDPSQAPTAPSFRSLDAEEKAIGGNTVEEDGSHEDSHMECAICMECFEDDDSIRSLTCGHIFHATCLDPWFTKRQARCPLCKTYYPPTPGSLLVPRRPAAVLIRSQIFPRVL
ncbi:hypothetical protein BDW59DRAFT_57426 [Aspergillus cavernicola]|uniref:RING-type E3 ubiquitin transferase n=1 Tax=Aspergillus cavernicola TaxID=176166 RepID=A0ABR4II32_9EURO